MRIRLRIRTSLMQCTTEIQLNKRNYRTNNLITVIIICKPESTQNVPPTYNLYY